MEPEEHPKAHKEFRPPPTLRVASKRCALFEFRCGRVARDFSEHKVSNPLQQLGFRLTLPAVWIGLAQGLDLTLKAEQPITE